VRLSPRLFLLVRIAYRHFRERDGLGLRDVKLAGAAGAWLSLPMLPISIEMAAAVARRRDSPHRISTEGGQNVPAVWD
jgi:prepilin signal peptidase PulO-like enzyme (type II secretory pathway)